MRSVNRKRFWAYPRSRGGTVVKMAVKKLEQGLSPLTRGNQECKAGNLLALGPIPAHAGEP